MSFNLKQSYTPALELYELNEHALIVDTETVGLGPTIEVIEIALGDLEGHILYESLVRPIFNRLPPQSKHARFGAFCEPPSLESSKVNSVPIPGISAARTALRTSSAHL